MRQKLLIPRTVLVRRKATRVCAWGVVSRLGAVKHGEKTQVRKTHSIADIP
jgi:hypothetical protein